LRLNRIDHRRRRRRKTAYLYRVSELSFSDVDLCVVLRDIFDRDLQQVAEELFNFFHREALVVGGGTCIGCTCGQTTAALRGILLARDSRFSRLPSRISWRALICHMHAFLVLGGVIPRMTAGC